MQEQTKLIIEQAKLNQQQAQAMLNAEQKRLQLIVDRETRMDDRAHEVALEAASQLPAPMMDMGTMGG
jgi:hypothetical protein